MTGQLMFDASNKSIPFTSDSEEHRRALPAQVIGRHFIQRSNDLSDVRWLLARTATRTSVQYQHTVRPMPCYG